MRAQSHVVGFALILGVTVVALGGLTFVVGSLVDAATASADADRVAAELEDTLRPLETTGPRAGSVHFADGSVRSVQREMRVLENGSVIDRRSVGGLVFETGERRVAYVAGAVVRGRSGSAWLVSEPPITSSDRTPVLVAGVARLETGDVAVGSSAPAGGGATGGASGTSVTLSTNVSHNRLRLGTGNYAVAVETTTPGPFERYFAGQNASVSTTDFDGDGVESVVADYPGRRRGYVVVHNLSLEVNNG